MEIKYSSEKITSRVNPLVVRLSKLSDAKGRKEEKLFLCEGVKLFEEAFSARANIKYVLVNDDIQHDEKIAETLNAAGVRGAEIIPLGESAFCKISTESAPQGIIAVVSYAENHRAAPEMANYKSERIMLFESVRDAGNLGTIMRSAAAFGIDRLILSSDCADIYSPKTVRASMGAVFKVKTDTYANLCDAVKTLEKEGRRVLAAVLDKDSLRLGESALSESDCVIIGNEGHGISEELKKSANGCIYIPMNANTESLNASVAASVVMWEFSKLKF